jgi:UDPglucose 6-dehydrogenase
MRAIEGSDALVIMTEWNQFRNLDMTRIKNGLAHPLIFDMRNIYRRAEMEEMGFTYHGVGI